MSDCATKVCRKCGEAKSLDGFASHPTSRDRRQYNCRPCQSALAREWNVANRERVREIDRARYARNPEKRKAVQRAIKERDPDAYRAKVRAQSAAAYRRDPKKHMGYSAAWRAKHPERARELGKASLSNYLARRKRAVGTHTASERVELMESYRSLCAYCLGRATCLDHVTPLSRGGSNDVSNLVPACRSCNSSKRSRTLLEYLVYRKAA